ncbi:MULTISPECIES: phosphodiester glycosidase family protein [Kosmotoga]|uniref:Phosphodiester glycosidase domain-containing protein n=1 Tax=Kosmotoga olearia (strain ATCC BAA-1733 / DSM 21960 / TBF 19.5.1) TaxID=521045 RepID=C5CET4_KOSOT|nr:MULTISPECIES: phosphodiester glycosidase family protein [Kosmotoga]ACR80264.1 hypothetical protein Kole_1574 [Kosmotoga olearia TBF 19.5.1]MDI3523452.1 hypothetical protein [Kosmotoga sp.]MDK2953005.1 hypothetical protein [Kosmotoga sp.]OAA20202.1 hypothetical protein DU53_08650 [Kosmotoga sp. DU53]
MRRSVIIILLVFCAVISIGKDVVFSLENRTLKITDNDVLQSYDNIFISVDSLGRLYNNILITEAEDSDEFFIFFPGNSLVTFSLVDGSATVEFGSKFHNAATKRDDKNYVSLSFLCTLLNLNCVDTEKTMIVYDVPPKIENISKTPQGLVFYLDRPAFPEMFSYWHTTSGALVITIKPAVKGDKLELPGSQIFTGTNYVKLYMNTASWSDLSVEVSENKLIVNSRWSLGRILKKDSGAGYFLGVFENYVSGRRIILTALELDPERFDIHPVLANGRIPSGESLLSMAKRYDAFAVINGGYFDPSSFYPIGLLIEDGKLISLPSLERPLFFQTEDGKMGIGRLDTLLFLSIGNVTLQVKGVNTPYRGSVVVYTREFSGKLPYHEDYVYAFLDGETISSIGYKEQIEGNESVILFSPAAMEKIEKLEPGMKVKFTFFNSFNEKLKFAIEGGPLIISRGKPVTEYEKSFYSSSLLDIRAPRTLIGITKSGTLMFMIIDGYQMKSYGLTFKEMVEFFTDKNFEYLMCVDGGKSSALVFKGEVFSSPSSGVPVVPVGIVISQK